MFPLTDVSVKGQQILYILPYKHLAAAFFNL